MKKRGTIQAMSAAALSAVMLLAATPALAAGDYSTTIEGTKTTTFDKYLLMNLDANVPNVSFTYEVTAGAAENYKIDGKTFEVLAGVDADKVTVTDEDAATAGFQLVFTPEDTTVTAKNPSVKNFNPKLHKYATKTATVDFSGVTFTEPGIYRYIITESGDNQGVTNDADLTRMVDVYVEDASTDTEEKLTIASYVLHASNASVNDSKSQGFTNTYDTYDLTFRKEVTGNQASHDKYFKFTVKISGAVPGTKYTVDLSEAEAGPTPNDATNYDTMTNPAELTAGADGAVTAEFYLRHEQEIRIMGLAKGTKYEVTEDAEAYISQAAAITGYTDAVKNETGIETDVKTSYRNGREGIIPTGIMMAVAPFAAITLIGGLGAASILLKKKKDEDD